MYSHAPIHYHYHSTITEVLDQSKTFTPNCKTGLFVSVWTFTRKLASLSPAAVRVITIDIGSAEHVNIYFIVLQPHWKQAELWQCQNKSSFWIFQTTFRNTLCFLNKPESWQWSISYHFPIMVQGEIICWSSKRKRSHPQKKICVVFWKMAG